MKIHVTRCPKAGSGIPLKLGFALKRTGALLHIRFWHFADIREHSSDVRFRGKTDNQQQPPALLYRNQIGAAQSRGFCLQRLVGGVRVELIKNLEDADRSLVVGGSEARIRWNNDGVASGRGSDGCISNRSADFPAREDQRGDPLVL